MEEITIYQGLFDLFLWGIIFVVLRPAFKPPFKLKKSSRIIGIGLILLFCLFPFWAGDYFHSRDTFLNIKYGGLSHFESVYVWIINNVATSYFMFRLIVWGAALTILLLAYKRIGFSFDLALFFFGALYLPLFSYARASLAMAILLLGLSFFYVPLAKSKVLSTVLGLVVISCSFFFHRSAVIGIFAVLMAFFLKENSKKKTLLLLTLIPIGVMLLSTLLDNVLMLDLDTVDEVMNNKIDSYMGRDAAEKGIARKLSDFLTRAPMFISAILYIVLVIKGDYQRFTIPERAVASYMFCIMLIAFGFSLNHGYNTYVFYYRTINYALPANALFLTSIKGRKLGGPLFKVIYIMALAAACYSLLYSTYMGYNRM